jgi:hypothetical protein
MGWRLALGVLLAGVPSAAPADDALWELLKAGGHVVVIRHASTDPGVGDPPGFRLGDCATQRNLSAAGARRRGGSVRRFAAVASPSARSSRAGGAAAWRLPGWPSAAWSRGPSGFCFRQPATRTSTNPGGAGASEQATRGREPHPGDPRGQYRRADRDLPSSGRDGRADPPGKRQLPGGGPLGTRRDFFEVTWELTGGW